MRLRWLLPVFSAATVLAIACVLPRYEADRDEHLVVGQDAGAEASPNDASLDGIDAEPEPRPCDECKDLSLLRAPCRPSIDDAPDSYALVFAARSLRYGVRLDDLEGDDWKTIGLDLDCLATNAAGEPTQCLMGDAGTGLLKASPEDGEQGRDNSFGSNFGRLFRMAHAMGSTQPDEEVQTNERWEQGLGGLLVQISGYSGADDDPKVKVAVLSTGGTLAPDGGPLPPAWDGNDEWTVASTSLSGGEPVFIDDNAHVTGGVVVAKLVTVPLQFGPGGLALNVEHPTLLMRLSADRTKVDEATMAGTWLTAQATILMDQLLQQGCVNEQLRITAIEFLLASSDVRHDLQTAPDVPCDAISFAFSFKAERAKLGSVITPSQAPPLDGGCSDAADK